MDLKGEPEVAAAEGRPPRSVVAFAGSSTLHGIGHIFTPGRPSLRRAVWALAFLGSLSFLAHVLVQRVRYYLEYPHVTKLDEVSAYNLTFPAVTVCNLNEFRFSKITKNDLYHAGELLALLNNRFEIPDPYVAEKHVLDVLVEKANFGNFKPKPFNMREFYDRAGHEMKDMLLDCKYRGKECTHQHFQVVFTRYGKCYTFNSGQTKDQPILTTLKGGTGNGLELMLDIQQDEYLPVWGETDETSFEAGIKVQIHGQNEPPFIDQLGFGVPPGFQTFVSCQEQRLIYLPPPWGDCKSTPMDSDFFDTYSVTACRIDCETRYLVENCNCRMVHMPGFLVEKDNLFCTCETPCNMTRYGKELSMVKIPSKASAKYLAKKYNKSEDYIGENILVLDIFFEALNYETIEQKKAYEVAGLLGDIGGQMGLFIGASLLTILEVFDYVYEVLKHKLCGLLKYGKQQKRNNNNKGVTLSLDDIKRHNPCENLRTHPGGMTYPANILPHHPPRSTFEDFTC
ncbi:acid-sensing ion channel 1-like isoform X1 [Rhinoraja longicauda]